VAAREKHETITIESVVAGVPIGETVEVSLSAG
jgi:hypothetical protein